MTTSTLLVWMIVTQASAWTAPRYVLPGFQTMEACEQAIPEMEVKFARAKNQYDADRKIVTNATAWCVSAAAQ